MSRETLRCFYTLMAYEWTNFHLEASPMVVWKRSFAYTAAEWCADLARPPRVEPRVSLDIYQWIYTNGYIPMDIYSKIHRVARALERRRSHSSLFFRCVDTHIRDAFAQAPTTLWGMRLYHSAGVTLARGPVLIPLNFKKWARLCVVCEDHYI